MAKKKNKTNKKKSTKTNKKKLHNNHAKNKLLIVLASIIIGIAILIFWPIFVHNGINTFVDKPDLEVYCANITYEISTDSCENMTVQNVEANYRGSDSMKNCWCDEICDDNGCKTTNKCHKTNPEYRECHKQWEQDSEKFRKTYFIAAILIGLIGLVVGLYLKNAPVSLGLMGGSIVIMIIGTGQYWGEMTDMTKFIFSGVVLVVLMFVAYKKLTQH